MKKIALMSDKDREELFIATALKIGIRPEAVEKDFWVCFILDHLFHDCVRYRADQEHRDQQDRD